MLIISKMYGDYYIFHMKYILHRESIYCIDNPGWFMFCDMRFVVIRFADPNMAYVSDYDMIVVFFPYDCSRLKL